MSGPADERRALALGLFAVGALRLAATLLPDGTDPPYATAPSAPTEPVVDEHARGVAISTRVLGGLAAGDRVGPLRVERVAPPRGGEIVVELTDDAGRGLRVWVRPAGTGGHVSAGDYALASGSPPPGLEDVDPDVAALVVRAVAERLEAAGEPVPDELR